ncbi:uncharacterized protein LOC134528505 [Bacillus rossius redtenbacheri]|uniref:uncharacterized protein LOC134528505 n=1 Tax=Bacillus rossius redtenbacheri TaxID=93214 RepID=UPI002FDCA1FF
MAVSLVGAVVAVCAALAVACAGSPLVPDVWDAGDTRGSQEDPGVGEYPEDPEDNIVELEEYLRGALGRRGDSAAVAPRYLHDPTRDEEEEEEDEEDEDEDILGGPEARAQDKRASGDVVRAIARG